MHLFKDPYVETRRRSASAVREERNCSKVALPSFHFRFASVLEQAVECGFDADAFASLQG